MPARKVIKNVESMRGEKLEEVNKLLASKRIVPSEATMNKQKEKLNASRGAKPSHKAIVIVLPDRETAGKMAKDCIRPIIRALLKFNFVVPLFVINLVEIKSDEVIRKK